MDPRELRTLLYSHSFWMAVYVAWIMARPDMGWAILGFVQIGHVLTDVKRRTDICVLLRSSEALAKALAAKSSATELHEPSE